MSQIDRQAAIEVIERMKPYQLDGDDCIEIIANLPSAQPELIWCKDCKHYEWDKLNDAYCCLKWGYNFPNEDDFCSRAERRTDG